MIPTPLKFRTGERADCITDANRRRTAFAETTPWYPAVQSLKGKSKKDNLSFRPVPSWKAGFRKIGPKEVRKKSPLNASCNLSSRLVSGPSTGDEHLRRLVVCPPQGTALGRSERKMIPVKPTLATFECSKHIGFWDSFSCPALASAKGNLEKRYRCALTVSII